MNVVDFQEKTEQIRKNSLVYRILLQISDSYAHIIVQIPMELIILTSENFFGQFKIEMLIYVLHIHHSF